MAYTYRDNGSNRSNPGAQSNPANPTETVPVELIDDLKLLTRHLKETTLACRESDKILEANLEAWTDSMASECARQFQNGLRNHTREQRNKIDACLNSLQSVINKLDALTVKIETKKIPVRTSEYFAVISVVLNFIILYRLGGI